MLGTINTLRPALSRPVTQYVRLPVAGPDYAVYDSSGARLEVQTDRVPDWVAALPGRVSQVVSQANNLEYQP